MIRLASALGLGLSHELHWRCGMSRPLREGIDGWGSLLVIFDASLINQCAEHANQDPRHRPAQRKVSRDRADLRRIVMNQYPECAKQAAEYGATDSSQACIEARRANDSPTRFFPGGRIQYRLGIVHGATRGANRSQSGIEFKAASFSERKARADGRWAGDSVQLSAFRVPLEQNGVRDTCRMPDGGMQTARTTTQRRRNKKPPATIP
jgi:hypothetical protein